VRVEHSLAVHEGDRVRSLLQMVSGESIADTTPLAEKIARQVDAAFLERVAAEHRRGWALVQKLIGDPAEDMGWICTNSWRFGRPDRPVGGFGDYADLLAGYAAAGGRPIDLSRVRFWQMLGSLRWGVMCLTMYLSWRDGAEKSVERPMIGRRVSETEADLVVLLEQGL
jgi:hypothetical protein